MASTSEPNGPLGFRELWSAEDRHELDAFLGAVRRDDLVAGLLAVAGATPDEAAGCKKRIAEWGRALASRMPSPVVSSPRQQIAALARLLSFEEGFKGDEDDYHDPRNSLLPEVIERRRGMPILLSCLWMAVGRAAGIRVEGIGLPGRFIVRVGGASGVFADPFAGGVVVGEDDCKRTVKELSGGTIDWSDDFLEPVRTDQVLERVLQNYFLSCRRDVDGPGCYRAAVFLAALRPDSPERQLALGDVAGEMGAREIAADVYTRVVESFPESPESEAAAEKLRQLEGETTVN